MALLMSTSMCWCVWEHNFLSKLAAACVHVWVGRLVRLEKFYVIISETNNQEYRVIFLNRAKYLAYNSFCLDSYVYHVSHFKQSIGLLIE